MKLELPNLPIGTRVMMALAVPIAGLAALTLWVLASHWRTANDMRDLREMTELATSVSALVHELQKERGVSAGFLGSSSTAFSTRLPTQNETTDQKRARFLRALKRIDPRRIDQKFGSSLRMRIAAAQERMGRLDEWRGSVASHAVEADVLTSDYAEAIESLIDIVKEMLLVSPNADLTRAIYAYTHFMELKETAGLERATGVAGFAAGQFDQTDLVRLIDMLGRQKSLLNEFRYFATPDQVSFLETAIDPENEENIERMRRVAFDSPRSGAAGGIVPAHWFDAMTRKIDALRTVEERLAADLTAQVEQIEESATRVLETVSVAATLLLVLTVSLAAALARGIILPLRNVAGSLGRLAALDSNAEIEGSDRGDEIGALARSALVFRGNLIKVAHAEEEAKSAAMLRLHHRALSSIAQGVLITGRDLRITFANAAFLKISGYQESEILGRDPSFMYGKDTDPEALARLRAALLAGQPFFGQMLNYRKDGSPFWNELSIAPVLDDEGRLVEFVGVVHDVTERQEVEQELRIAATAFESLHGMMVTDAKGVILRINHAFTDMTGYGADEVIGRTPSILKSGRHSPEFYAGMWRQLHDKGAWDGEIWDRRKNGEIFPKWQSISAVRGPDGRTTHYVVAFSDITERKEAEEHIRNLAFYDPLTRLPNRRLLLDRLRQALALSDRTGREGAVLFIDLDNFKTLNDTQGHDVGDLLLIEVASRLQSCLREGDTVARLGGDEFVVLLEDLDPGGMAAAQAEVVGMKILAALDSAYLLKGHSYHSTPSIGIALFGEERRSVDELLRHADLAMYQAKAAGRNTVRFFDPKMQSTVTERSQMETDLREALQEGQFHLVFQPQADFSTGRTIGAEALIRWRHPERGLIPPTQFIPVAEETGLIVAIGDWVLREACAQVKAWRASGLPPLTIAVNLSARQFRQENLAERIVDIIEEACVDPAAIELEITESTLMDCTDDATRILRDLHERGFRIAIDDFGTGYSSLTYLKRFPVDKLKIDRSFVMDIPDDTNDVAITSAIIQMSKSLGIKVVAEGVETEAQHDFLRRQDCTFLQGFLYSRPIDAGSFELFLKEQSRQALVA